MAIRCVLADLAVSTLLDLGDVEVGPATEPFALGGRPPREVLVVSADPGVLAAAGAAGAHRLVAGDPEATATAVVELIRELQRS
jgi:hypothetical protein